MNKTRTKSTSRFNFTVQTNSTSHKTGANTVSISVKDYSNSSGHSRGYSTTTGDVSPGQTVTMTVKEAKALQKFLNTCFSK